MEAYPQNVLPLPLIDHSVEDAEGVVRLQFQSGRMRSRPKYSRPSKVSKLTWFMTQYQYSLFQSFLELKISNGADWFTMPLKMGEQGASEYTVRIQQGTISATRQHPGWRVTASIETRARALPVTQSALDALIAQEQASPGT